MGAPSGTGFDQDDWEQRLPAVMMDLARELPTDQPFDALVVDEAQDFADAWWTPLLAALADEEAGAVYVSSDKGQQVYDRHGPAGAHGPDPARREPA